MALRAANLRPDGRLIGPVCPGCRVVRRAAAGEAGVRSASLRLQVGGSAVPFLFLICSWVWCFCNSNLHLRVLAAIAMAEQERPSVRRRSSFGRALDRVRDALKRRRSSAAAVATLQSMREEQAAVNPSATEQPDSELLENTKQDEGAVTETKAAEPRESIADSQLVPDDGMEEDMDSNEEPLTPAFSSRMGISEDKAKALFERYGIKYPSRYPVPSGETSPSKIRRVERPVRIRIHWTCHECHRQFGHDRACVSCGHRRCSDCTRAPPKKVKAILDEAKQSQMAAERSEVDRGQILAAIAPNTVAAAGQPRIASDDPLELDADETEDVDISQYTMEQRPRSGIKLVMRTKAPKMRQVCHECQTPFRSQNRTECEGCGHQRCDACPTRTVRPAGQNEAPFEPTMVATVQRVYRKPRQRVRWQCDKCQTVFVDSHRCRVCDHQRCGDCIRSPYVNIRHLDSSNTVLTCHRVKRAPTQPDPAVLQSLNDKIDAWQRQRSQAPESTTFELEPEPGLS